MNLEDHQNHPFYQEAHAIVNASVRNRLKRDGRNTLALSRLTTGRIKSLLITPCKRMLTKLTI